ncbi:MAG: leucyl aminopeptidase [Gammaproteobacteria bacterium]|nr:leucyl aminopeptidase [Gammaproteobacteria bacterium]
MEFSVKSGNPEKQRTACVVVGIFEPRRLSQSAEQIDKASDSYLSNIIRRGDIEGKLGQSLLLHNVPGTLCDRVLLVGCGRERELSPQKYNRIITTATKALNEGGTMEAVFYLTDINIKGQESEWKVSQLILAVEDVLYRFDVMKSEKDEFRRPLRKIIISIPSRRELAECEDAVKSALAIANGMTIAKDLGNLPGNVCTPTYMAEQASDIAQQHETLTTTILEESDMLELGMGALLSVSRGSREPAKLIVMEYKGGQDDEKPVVLVGKGLTFDAGGISIKPSAAMDEMKYDMCGGASVIGVMQACAELNIPLNVTGVVPSSENLPDGEANKPGDIVTSMSGLTIEILNTDAEGRLILCDALTYSERFDPAVVIDIATLTGACVVALGHHAQAILSNHSPLTHELLNAGKHINDKGWELPLWDEYQSQLDSNFADMANIGGRDGGSITAACFLSRYTKKFKWAHLDIAGTAWKSGKEKGSTGRPVPMLMQFLLNRVN